MEEEKKRTESGKARVWIPILCVLCLLAGAASALAGACVWLGEDTLSLVKAYVLVEKKYVGDYDAQTVREETLDAMVKSLGDRWSYYLTPEAYQRTKETRKNAYVGIGVTVSGSDSDLVILSVVKGGPAESAGIQAGETITAVDGVKVTAETRDSCVDAIGGKIGTTVTLEIKGTDGSIRTVEVTRGNIQNVSAAWTMLDGDVALLTIANFYSGTAAQTEACLDELTAAGAKALAVDVRYNPGGYVTELTRILDDLLPAGEVFHSSTVSGRETTYTSDEACIDLPVGVLVNGDSYSAAEFLAAQLRESGGAVIVGTRTCGKGFAQTLFPLPDGSAVGLSTSRYVTGSGLSLVGTGVAPDKVVEMSEEDGAALCAGALSPEEDCQLQALLGLLEREE